MTRLCLRCTSDSRFASGWAVFFLQGPLTNGFTGENYVDSCISGGGSDRLELAGTVSRVFRSQPVRTRKKGCESVPAGVDSTLITLGQSSPAGLPSRSFFFFRKGSEALMIRRLQLLFGRRLRGRKNRTPLVALNLVQRGWQLPLEILRPSDKLQRRVALGVDYDFKNCRDLTLSISSSRYLHECH